MQDARGEGAGAAVRSWGLGWGLEAGQACVGVRDVWLCVTRHEWRVRMGVAREGVTRTETERPVVEGPKHLSPVL